MCNRPLILQDARRRRRIAHEELRNAVREGLLWQSERKFVMGSVTAYEANIWVSFLRLVFDMRNQGEYGLVRNQRVTRVVKSLLVNFGFL